MPIPCDYYWKDKNGQTVKSRGIELTQEEKAALCHKNVERIRKQLDGKSDTSIRELPEVDTSKVLEFRKGRTKS